MKTPELRSVDQQYDWKKVLFEVIVKILTLGFYHIEKHTKN